MGLDYSFEFIAPRSGTDTLLRALADRVDHDYAERLRACLPWTPNSLNAANAGVRGLPPVFEISNHYDLVIMLPVDADVQRHYDDAYLPIARHIRDGKVGVGLVYMDLHAGERFVTLTLTAATSDMSRLFASSGSAHGVMTSLAAAGEVLAAFLDCERHDDWELLFPRPPAHASAITVPRPPDWYQTPTEVDAYCEQALEFAGLRL